MILHFSDWKDKSFRVSLSNAAIAYLFTDYLSKITPWECRRNISTKQYHRYEMKVTTIYRIWIRYKKLFVWNEVCCCLLSNYHIVKCINLITNIFCVIICWITCYCFIAMFLRYSYGVVISKWWVNKFTTKASEIDAYFVCRAFLSHFIK